MFSNNQHFCYWLQGYFEIAQHPTLSKEKLKIIEQHIMDIKAPLGNYTKWLQEVIDVIKVCNYRKSIINFFEPLIKEELNKIFFHVIDNSYHPKHAKDKLLRIHHGEQN